MKNTHIFSPGLLFLFSRRKGSFHEAQIHYLRKVLRSPACVMATSVFVTEVPMLVPMMIGTATWTVNTVEAHRHPSISSSLMICFLCMDVFLYVLVEGRSSYSQPEETMLTTMEEEVDELWTSRVTRTPMTKPARGLDKILLSWKMSPAVLPGPGEH